MKFFLVFFLELLQSFTDSVKKMALQRPYEDYAEGNLTVLGGLPGVEPKSMLFRLEVDSAELLVQGVMDYMEEDEGKEIGRAHV